MENKVSAFSLKLPNAHVKLKTQTERRLYEADGQPYIEVGLGFVVNLNPIINTITGRTKMLKNRFKIEQSKNNNKTFKNYFQNDFFTKTLEIPLEKVDDFILFCALNDSVNTFFSNTNETFKVIGLLKEKSNEYRILNDLIGKE